MSGICLQAQDRPPIVTNTIYLSNFIWQNDLIGKDTLYYLRFDDANCFSTKGLNAGDVWEQHCFATPGDSTLTIFEGDSIWIVDGGTYTRNDSVFEVRRDPTCGICWDYKYSTDLTWKILFCENIASGRFLIGGTANDIFYMVYGGSFTNWQDYFFFHVDKADSNKVLTMMPDSTVRWQLPKVDSLLFEDTGKWLKTKDTIPSQRDSIFFKYNTARSYSPSLGYKANNDTLVIDSSLWIMTSGLPYGIRSKKDNIGVGVDPYWQAGITAYHSYMGISGTGEQTGVYGNSTSHDGVFGQSGSGRGVVGSSFLGTGIGVYGIANTINWAGYFTGGRGLFGTALKVSDIWYPNTHGNAGQILKTDGDSVAYWDDLATYNSIDSFFVFPDSIYLTENDTLDLNWKKDANGIKYSENVGIGNASSSNTKLVVVSTVDNDNGIYINLAGGTGVSSNTTDWYGVLGNATTGVGVAGTSTSGYGIEGQSSTGYSGYFTGGLGLSTDKLKVGGYTHPSTIGSLGQFLGVATDTTLGWFDAADSFYLDLNYNYGWISPEDTVTISLYDFDEINGEMQPDSGDVWMMNGTGQWDAQPTGTMINYDFWFGSQAEWTANTPHDGIYPQATTTIWHVKD